jgi:UDP-N-acetylmuramoyl-tripeptide--D-alanyl-D-alanine ligase
MISITLSQAAASAWRTAWADLTIDAVTTDTRKVTAGCLFVALKGERFDAHDFAEQARTAPARCWSAASWISICRRLW